MGYVTHQIYQQRTSNKKEELTAHEILKLKGVHSTAGYSHAAKAGKLLDIAGQIARDVDGNLVGKGDFETQVRQVYTNLKNIMVEAGGNLQDTVKMPTFLTHYN